MQEIYSNTTFNVSHLINKIETGELGLPELQRPFVWKDTKVRDLLDSMMKGYPVGYLMLWKCPDSDGNRVIGTGTHNYESPREVIIDGQQRLTSLYAVMKGGKVLNSKYEERTIVISYCPLKNRFEVGTSATKRDPEWIYDITELYTATSSRRFTNSFISTLAAYREARGETLSEEEQDTIAARI